MASKGGRVNAVMHRGVGVTHDGASSLLESAGDLAVVNRGRLRSVVMLCPCGCGDELVVNVDSRVGPAWRIYENAKGITVFPSVWRESGCESHFIIWNNKVYWCDYDSLWDDYLTDPALDSRVLDVMRVRDLLSYKDISESLNEIPWSVLLSCRRLVKKGLAREGTGKSQGFFCKMGLDLKV